MNGVKAANEAVRFLVELCMLAAFAYWGSATAALLDAGATTAAIGFAALAAVNTTLVHVWGEGQIKI